MGFDPPRRLNVYRLASHIAITPTNTRNRRGEKYTSLVPPTPGREEEKEEKKEEEEEEEKKEGEEERRRLGGVEAHVGPN